MKKMVVTLFVCAVIFRIAEGRNVEDNIVGRIDETVLRATVKIETSGKTYGTGFIVSKPTDSGGRYLFLVTNKHLVGDYSFLDGCIKSYYDFINVSLYKKDGSIQKIPIALKDKQGKVDRRRAFPYPKPYIDIVVIPVADLFAIVTESDYASFDVSYLATSEILKKWCVDIGDQVFALGYPYDIYSRSNNYPIAKSGYISSKIGKELVVKLPHKNENGKTVSHDLKAKVILLDGTLVAGNSGGPIIVPRGRKETTNVDTNKSAFSNRSIPNFVIGIQSQSLQIKGISVGISIAFSSEYILELIDMIVGGSTSI